MRVVLVSPYDLSAPGGVQSHVRRLAEALRGHGDEVRVVGPGRGGDHLSVGGSVGVRFNGSVAPVALGPGAALATRRLLARLRADVVHVHEPIVPVVGMAAATAPGAPVVATYHASSEDARAYRLVAPLGRRLLDRVHAAIAVSPAAAAYHAGALGVDERRFALVPNGVDVERFAGARPLSELEAGPPTLLFVGRLERRKGLEVLVRAFTRLKARWPTARLLVVGEGPERDRCRGLLPDALRADVRFLGRLDEDGLARCFASADVFVSPALGGESFGIVLLEAMAAGRPVVASDLPGYRSVVHDGREGRLVPPGEPAALADAIEVLLGHPRLREAMAGEGRRTARRHAWPTVAERVRAVYLRALGAAA